MENLSIGQARSLLLGDDIRPMTLPEDEAYSSEGEQGHDGDSGESVTVEAEEASEGERCFDDGEVGLGVDIVEIERMRSILERIPSFSERVFTMAERLYCDRMADSPVHYALRFAGKEAVVKALGTGFSEGIWVQDVEIDRDKKGKPFVRLSGRALEVAEEQGVKELQVSLSYTHNDAVACAMAVTESSIKATEKRKDPMEELAQQFKETRKMLDEL